MSLDVTLYGESKNTKCTCSACGNEHTNIEREELYWANITHNLGTMAAHAGIYEALWRPYRLFDGFKNVHKDDYDAECKFESSIKVLAKDIILPIEIGLNDMKARPDYYKQYNSENGWGLYHHFIPFIEKYLEACKEHPEATVSVSR